MIATYHTPFEDFDYESWTAEHRLFAKVEPDPNGGFFLIVEGAEQGIDAFTAELGLKPMSKAR